MVTELFRATLGPAKRRPILCFVVAGLFALACGGDGDGGGGDAPLPPPPTVFGTCKPPARNDSTNVALESALGDATFTLPIELVKGPGKRIYVLEQKGVVKAVSPTGDVTPALDIGSKITSGGEAGLLGIAFDPSFAENGFVYLDFTAPLPAPRPGVVFQTVVARFQSRDGGATFDPTSEKRLLVVDQPFSNHNGGKIGFGPDRYLYVSLGDGGSAGDPNGNGQNTNVLLGKILRIDVAGGKDPYVIPPDNPFASGGGRGEVFAYGLRNPWKFSWDRVTGEMWAGDVGQNKYEEIDRIEKGKNYGWNVREGMHCFGAATCATDGLTDPVVEYGRSDGLSVTGGYVYRGSKVPGLDGRFVFGDFGSGRIWAITRDEAGQPKSTLLLESALKISSFGEDEDGELLVADYATGKVKRLVAAAASAPDEGPSLLSATGCLDPKDPSRAPGGAIPYAVNSPLWSDGAAKDRWLFVPEGQKIGVLPDGDFDVPPGSVAVKTFIVGGKRVETRLLVRYADASWAGFSYEWNDDQGDAVLLPGPKTKPVAGGQAWSFPSRGECFVCHTAVAKTTLGLEARQLDREDQLTRFAPVLDRPVEKGAFPALAAADTPGASAEARARGYLHSNCSVCHREGGGAGAATMDLRADRTLSDTRTCNVAPQGGDLGVAGARLVAPGDPGRSVVLLRMRSTDDRRMPPLATHLVDTAGVAAVEAWIAGLTSCP